MENTILLIMLFLSHYLVDYTPIGNTIEFENKKYFTAFIHSWIHCIVLGMLLVNYSVFIHEIKLYDLMNGLMLQLWSHFLIDASVGLINDNFKQLNTKSNQMLILGYDQFMHSLVLILIYNLITN